MRGKGLLNSWIDPIVGPEEVAGEGDPPAVARSNFLRRFSCVVPDSHDGNDALGSGDIAGGWKRDGGRCLPLGQLAEPLLMTVRR